MINRKATDRYSHQFLKPAIQTVASLKNFYRSKDGGEIFPYLQISEHNSCITNLKTENDQTLVDVLVEYLFISIILSINHLPTATHIPSLYLCYLYHTCICISPKAIQSNTVFHPSSCRYKVGDSHIHGFM